MEKLAPTLEWVMQLRAQIESGQSVLTATQKSLLVNVDEVSMSVRALLKNLEVGLGPQNSSLQDLNPYRRALLELIRRGLRGEPILPQLRDLEKEVIFASEVELEQFMATLPIKMILSVLLFQFPAFLLLMLAPLVTQFLKGF